MKTSIGHLNWLFTICILLMPMRGSAFSLEVEYARGVVAFSQGQYKKAKKRFRQVLSHDPSHLQATYYLGQVALQLGHNQRAIELFTKVLKRENSFPAIRLDLALALVRQQRYDLAQNQLQQAAQAMGQRASIQYYLGVCQYKLGLIQKAQASLHKAIKLDQGFATSAKYYLGLVRAKSGQKRQAIQIFQQIMRTGQDASLKNVARENLWLLDLKEWTKRTWTWHFTTGSAYDSNVTLEQEKLPAQASPSVFFSTGFHLFALQRLRHRIDLAANLYRNFHLSQQAQAFDLTDLAAQVRYKHLFAGGHQLQLAYFFDLDMLDDLSQIGGQAGFGVYMQGHTAQALFQWEKSPTGTFSLAYQFQAQIFQPENRDNFGHRFLLHHAWYKDNLGLRLQTTLLGFIEDARDRSWDLWGVAAQLEANIQVRDWLLLSLGIDWQREDHYRYQNPNQAGKRVDDLFGGACGIQLLLSENTSLGLRYRYRYNDSHGLDTSNQVNPFRYARHWTGLILLVKL